MVRRTLLTAVLHLHLFGGARLAARLRQHLQSYPDDRSFHTVPVAHPLGGILATSLDLRQRAPCDQVPCGCSERARALCMLSLVFVGIGGLSRRDLLVGLDDRSP